MIGFRVPRSTPKASFPHDVEPNPRILEAQLPATSRLGGYAGEVASNSMPERLGRHQSTTSGQRVRRDQGKRADLRSEGRTRYVLDRVTPIRDEAKWPTASKRRSNATMDATTKRNLKRQKRKRLAEFTTNRLILLARPERFELPTTWFVARIRSWCFL